MKTNSSISIILLPLLCWVGVAAGVEPDSTARLTNEHKACLHKAQSCLIKGEAYLNHDVLGKLKKAAWVNDVNDKCPILEGALERGILEYYDCLMEQQECLENEFYRFLLFEEGSKDFCDGVESTNTQCKENCMKINMKVNTKIKEFLNPSLCMGDVTKCEILSDSANYTHNTHADCENYDAFNSTNRFATVECLMTSTNFEVCKTSDAFRKAMPVELNNYPDITCSQLDCESACLFSEKYPVGFFDSAFLDDKYRQDKEPEKKCTDMVDDCLGKFNGGSFNTTSTCSAVQSLMDSGFKSMTECMNDQELRDTCANTIAISTYPRIFQVLYYYDQLSLFISKDYVSLNECPSECKSACDELFAPMLDAIKYEFGIEKVYNIKNDPARETGGDGPGDENTDGEDINDQANNSSDSIRPTLQFVTIAALLAFSKFL